MITVFLSLFLATSLFGGIKEDIASLQEKLKSAPRQEKSKISLELANLYLQDQEQDKAFENFITSLETHPQTSEKAISPEEKIVYDEALLLYYSLSHDPINASRELLKKYEEVLVKNPSWAHLKALLSTSHANVGSFEKFFADFYDSYFPQNFLASKTKGILLLRLSTHAKNEETREKLKKEALECIVESVQKNPLDPSLYRLGVVLAAEKNDEKTKIKFLETLSSSKVPFARSDIAFYVKECVDVKRKDIGEALLKSAQERFEYSRSVGAAKEYLKNAR